MGAYFGLMKTRMRKSARKKVITYLNEVKSSLNKMNMSDRKVPKNRIPAAALTSRSFNTGMLYPSTVSPNCTTLLTAPSICVLCLHALFLSALFLLPSDFFLLYAFSYAIALNRVTRFWMGGCVPMRSAMNPSRSFTCRPSGSAMQRCAVPF